MMKKTLIIGLSIFMGVFIFIKPSTIEARLVKKVPTESNTSSRLVVCKHVKYDMKQYFAPAGETNHEAYMVDMEYSRVEGKHRWSLTVECPNSFGNIYNKKFFHFDNLEEAKEFVNELNQGHVLGGFLRAGRSQDQLFIYHNR